MSLAYAYALCWIICLGLAWLIGAGKSRADAGFLLGLLLGPLGVALMYLAPPGGAECPWCRMEIPVKAKVCPYCTREINVPTATVAENNHVAQHRPDPVSAPARSR